ncbi:AzlD domain-containing protein [Pseudobacillus badius]|uniref:AzlD domain-containing protein n=1 Tax=Bacillus badius TaxID=1455 RepID=UPI0007B0835A|nr:AzlD domain-containing protein [Bacillus badius]KZN99626.1 branched-chain amino acid transporter AzlD [Bacillus badius]OCS85730.1 branched-chain amino acid transporter AzlD [Bacillus badius]OVE51914.1 branched-chain amino acid transporter AzlD [Bacillus badius]TDW03349.1 branched-subunit amino acid transport protein [Bacillus badius]
MSINITTLLILAGCAVVTWIPRVAPFLIVRNLQLPDVVMKWLSFIPICILTALIAGSVIDNSGAATLPAINWQVLAALIPTLFVALWTKSLLATVIFGIVVMAALRNFV